MRAQHPLLPAACSLVLLSAIRAAGIGPLSRDVFPKSFAPLPGFVEALPSHVAAAFADSPPTLPATLCTNVLGLSARYQQTLRPGHATWVGLIYTNLSPGAYHIAAMDDASAPVGVRYFALHADGSRTLLRDEAYSETTWEPWLGAGESLVQPLRLSPTLVNAAAGSEGLVVAYANVTVSGWCLYAESQPLPVLPEPWVGEPPPLTQTEWQAQVTNWVHLGVVPWPAEFLKEYPEAGAFFPGVVVDDTLPDAFRLAFAERFPEIAAYDNRVYQFIVDAPDKNAPLVIAALGVVRNMNGATPQETFLRKAVGQTLYYMSQVADNPVLFRMHAANLFRVPTPYEDFAARTEPNFKLLAADDFRHCDARDFSLDRRATLRAGLTAMLTSTDPFVPGPLADKYPENATIGQVAAIILADLEAKWAAEPPRQE